ncbi:MAG: hypothetical protein NUV82_04810 [Candidatus Komeilibacteria bacterium]|nr:hypothetical protein [Candidatus Komeilibacteria bacterium]
MDLLRQISNLVFALTQILAGWLPMLFGVGMGVGEQSAGSQTAVIPAGYAFSIWGLIFLLALIYAIYQLFPSQRQNKLLRQVGWWTAGAFLFNTIWELVAQFVTFGWPTAVIILIIGFFAIGALLKLTASEQELSKTEKWVIWAPVSMLAGWISAAVFANISSVLYQLNFNNFGLSATAFAQLLLVIAVVFAGYVLYKAGGNWLYGLTILWALVAIAVANISRTANEAVVATVAILGVLFVIEMIVLIYPRAEKNGVVGRV